MKEIEGKCCKNTFNYKTSSLEVEEDRDMRGYNYTYWVKCPICGCKFIAKIVD